MFTSAYLAGLLDGEGCIFVAKQSHSGRPRVKVTIAQKNFPFLQAIRDFIGAGILRPNTGPGNWVIAFERNQDVITFLVPLIPHLILKKTEAQLAVDLCGINVEKHRLSDAEKSEQERLFTEMKSASALRKEDVNGC